MKIRLADNLRKLRKDNGMTQEELAERLNVSVGVVSKWERGASEPELGCLVEIAEVFMVSVDSLIGYNMAGENPADAAERIADLKRQLKVAEAVEYAEEALIRFPNDLRVVAEAASLYSITENAGLEANYDKAIALFKKAISLLSQDTEGKFSEMEFRTNIAMCLLEQEKYDEGIEVLKANNACGNSEDMWGAVLIHDKKDYEEGMQHLAKATLYLIERFVRIATSGASAYAETKRLDMAERVCNLFDSVTSAMAINPEKPTLFDKINAMMQTMLAIELDKNADEHKAGEYLRKAYCSAEKYDSSPVRNVDNMLFASEIKKGAAAFDDVGEVSVESVEKELEKGGTPKLLAMWKQLTAESAQADKKVGKKDSNKGKKDNRKRDNVNEGKRTEKRVPKK